MGFLEENLRVLRRRFGELAREVEEAKAGRGIDVVSTPGGLPSLRVEGLALHSLYEPVREAEVQVKRFLSQGEEGQAIFVLGLGLGYHVEHLLRWAGQIPVVVVEPSMAIFRRALETRKMGSILRGCRDLFVGRDVEEVLQGMGGRISREKAWRVFVHPPSMKIHGGYFQRITNRIEARNIVRGQRFHVLVVPPIYGGSLPIARFCLRALRKLGHRVTMIDNSGYHGLFKEIETITSNRFHRRQLQGSLTQHLSEIVMAKCLDANPDLILALAQAPLTPDILERMRGFGIPTAFWFVEDFRELTYWKEVAGRYDQFFAIQDRAVFEESESLEGVDFTYLPLACDPEIHRPIKLSSEDRRRFGSQVSFVGAGYYNRQILFEGLLDLDFKIWGTEWDLLSPLGRVVQEKGRRVSSRESVKVFNASTININLHSSTYHKGINPTGDFVNPRTFEIASSRAFQLVDPRSHLPGLFKADEEIVCFENIEDLREKIAYYSARPAERERIATNGQKRARGDHTYQKRMFDLLVTVVEKNLPHFVTLKRRYFSPERLIREAGPDTELGRFLSRFKEEDVLTLDTIVSEIRRGTGKLTDPEIVFLLMHEFSQQKQRRLQELWQ